MWPELASLTAEYDEAHLNQFNDQWRLDLGVPAFPTSINVESPSPKNGITVKVQIKPGVPYQIPPEYGTLDFIQDIEGKRFSLVI